MVKGKFAIGAIIGAAAGIVAGVLTAPKSGKQTRGDIKKKAAELKKTGDIELKNVEKEIATIKRDVAKAAKDLTGSTDKTTTKPAGKASGAVKKSFKK